MTITMPILRARRLVALALAALPAALAAQQRAPDWSDFDRYAAQAARDWRVPGLAVAVVHGDSTVLARGYGVADAATGRRATEHTRFAIGSTTKAMTSMALAMLVEEGRLRWDDRVIDHVPELRLFDPYATRELTVRDILLHRSGLPNTDVFWSIAENQPKSDEVLRRLRHVRPVHSFRSAWLYQNVVYALGGLVVERVSGKSWEAFLRERLFAPLGMRESETLVSALPGKPDVALPHREIGDSLRSVPFRSTDVVASAGSVYSSVSDMARWLRFVLDSGRVGDRRLVSAANFREMVTPQIRVAMSQYPALERSRPSHFSYGLGWFVQDYRGAPVWMHTGSIDGMSAIVGLLPAQRVAVVVLANLDHAEVRHALMYRAFDEVLGGARRDWSGELRTLFASRAQAAPAQASRTAAAAPHSLPLDRYAGVYADSAFGRIEVRLQEGTLHARYDAADLGRLEHAQHETFRGRRVRPTENPVPLTFVPNGTGGVASVRAFGQTFARVP